MLLWLRKVELESSKPKADTEFWVIYHYIIIMYQKNWELSIPSKNQKRPFFNSAFFWLSNRLLLNPSEELLYRKDNINFIGHFT